ncbi:MAG: YfhO family protein [Bacteroidota bacterium]
MVKIDFKTDVLPHLIALLIFLFVSVTFYYPMFLEGKEFGQHDILQGIGANQEVRDFRAETGEEALWTNSMFSGMPAYLISVRWSGELIRYVQQIISFGLPREPALTFISFLSFYILLLAFNMKPGIALFGALAYGLNTFNIISIEAGHIWKVRAMAYMPLVVAGIHLVFKGRKILGFALTALAMALEIQANHLQITYYLALLLLIYGAYHLYEAIQNKELKSLSLKVGIIILAVVLGFGANFGRLWSTYEYGKYSSRGPSDLVSENRPKESGLDRDYVFRWSHGIGETFTFLIPNFYGGPSQSELSPDSELGKALRKNGLNRNQIDQQLKSVPTYWGQQPIVAGPIYPGVIMIFFCVLGFLVLPKRTYLWLLIGIILSLMLAWGKNLSFFNYFMFDYFPGYDKFRSVSMAMSIALLCIPLFATLSVNKFLQGEFSKEKIKSLLIAGSIVLGSILILIIFSSGFNFKGAVDSQLGNLPDWFIRALKKDRQGLLTSDGIRSLFFIASSAAVIYFWAKGKIKPVLGTALLITLVLADLWLVDRRFIEEENFIRNRNRQFFSESAADKSILNDQNLHHRTLNLLNPWNESTTSYFHKSVGGYHGAKMKRYQELIDACLSNETQEVITKLQSGSTDFSSLSTLNMLNAKYFKFGDQAQQVIPNGSGYGNAWFVKNVTHVNSANEELEQTCELSTKNRAVVDVSRFEISSQNYSTDGDIRLLEYRPNYLKYEFSNSGNGFLVFSEVYYPEGWISKIDGEEQEHIRTNYVLRGMEVPSGKHVIEFEFRPEAYYAGNKISLVSSVLLLLITVGVIFIEFRKTKSE